MKAVKSIRHNDDQFGGDTSRRGTKLTPNKKSGKERHHLYQNLEEEDEEDDYYSEQRESIFDYLNDEDEEDAMDED
ncbi:MAG: hypothetical protein SNI51_07400 [Rikenellaceae bacterium]